MDDDPDVLVLLRAAFARAGLAADTALTAAEAIDRMRQVLYRVVIADIHMPGTSGIQLLSSLKQISPLVQVIMLTADASVERVIECIDRGAADFFSKRDVQQIVRPVADALARGERWAGCIGTRSIPMTPAHA